MKRPVRPVALVILTACALYPGLSSVFQANAAFGVHVLPWLQPELELNFESSFGVRSQVLAATAGVVAPFGAGHRVVAAGEQCVVLGVAQDDVDGGHFGADEDRAVEVLPPGVAEEAAHLLTAGIEHGRSRRRFRGKGR